MLGKAKCKILKEIRQKIADENDIPYVTRECTYQGDCSGTCPRCESELRYLERELESRKRLGRSVAITALCAGITVGATGCSLPIIGGNELSGDTEPYTEELSGEVDESFSEEWELEGDVAEEPPSDLYVLEGEEDVWEDDDCSDGSCTPDGDYSDGSFTPDDDCSDGSCDTDYLPDLEVDGTV